VCCNTLNTCSLHWVNEPFKDIIASLSQDLLKL
jgi:hypothetical protein